MGCMENAGCGVRRVECEVCKLRGVENAECGNCRALCNNKSDLFSSTI